MKRSGFCIALITAAAFVTLFWSRAEISSLSASSPEESTIKQPLSALVSVEAQPDIVSVGQTFSVLVRVDGLSANLSSFQVDLDFDSSVVDFVSSQPGALLESSGRNVICPPTARKSFAGIRHACATSGPVPGASGDGPLVLFTFRALAGGHSPLTLSNLVLSDDQRPPGLIGASTIDGGVDVADNFTPVAASDAYTTTEDIPLSQAAPGVLANDEDADDDPLTAELDIGPSYGELILGSDGAFAYTPTLNFNGQDSFTYHANDGLADSNIAVVTLTVTSENDPPVAVADGYATIENIPLNISSPGILANDDDADNDPLSAVLDNGPISGALDLSPDGGFVYTPTQNFSGFDNFSYHAHDGIAGSNIASVAITVTAGQVTDYFVFIPLVLRSTSSTDFDTGGGNSSGGESISPTSDVEATSSGKANFTPGNKLHWTAGMFFALVLFTWYSAPLRDSVRPKRSTFTRALRRISSHKAFKGLSIIVVMSLVLSAAMPLLPARAQSSTSQTATPAAELPDELSDQNYPQGADNRGVQSAPSSDTGSTGRPPQDIRLVDGYWADLDGDHDVDTADLSIIADFWDCASGDGCYIPQFDYDINDVIDAQDLAWIGNEYDVAPPEISIVAPVDDQVSGSFNVFVAGLVTDTHTVISVTVNDQSANLVGADFSTTISLPAGNQTIIVVAEDELGQIGIATDVVLVDAEGPMIEIHQPKDRQAVYSLTPTILISYTDFYTGVNLGSLSAILIDDGGVPHDVTADLSATVDGASGILSAPLAGDTVYTLTISLNDSFSNPNSEVASIYVPADPGSITKPAEPENAGWVSGVIYDSSTCNEHLTICDGLPGASVTLAYTGGLPITGTIVTGPDGLFAFPVAETGHYWIRVEKENYTYGQRAAEIVRERSSATNEMYLTPMDAAVTPCDDGGCLHVSSDGVLEVEIPPGAIAPGHIVTTTATNFEQVEFLPSGELPPGTWETYAFNLGGDSEITFTVPITVRQQNSIGFDPGTQIPLGYWNQNTLQWEHKSFGVVDPTGQWVVMNVTGFSNYDCNFPVALADLDLTVDIENETANDDQSEDECPAAESGCTVNLKSGTLMEAYELAPVQVLGEPVAPMLLYNSTRAESAEIIDLKVTISTPDEDYWKDFALFELYVEGIKTDRYWFDISSLLSANGRIRYLWDGHDVQGNPLPPGAYDYRVNLRFSYVAEYCGTGVFGGQPDCVNFPTGRYTTVYIEESTWGIIELDTELNSPWGDGWALAGMQRLYEDEAGRIMIADGMRKDAFTFNQKNLLLDNGTESYAAVLDTFPTDSIPVQDRSVYLSASTDDTSSSAMNWEGDSDTEIPGRTRERADLTELVDQSPLENTIGESDVLESDRRERDAVSPPSGTAPEIVPPRIESLPPYSETPSLLGTLVAGEISTDTVWIAGTYLVTGTVTVLPSVTLTVEAGVTVQFVDSSVDLFVAGNLLATGSDGVPVIFQPQSGTVPGSWGQVAFLPGSTGILKHTELEYGGADGGMLYLESDLVQVLDSEVRFSADTGIVIHAASPLISGTRVLTNIGNYGGGIYIDSGSPWILNSLIQDNFSSRAGGGILNSSGSPTIQNNFFLGNTATYKGGGIGTNSGNPTIQSNFFLGNTTMTNGGGIGISGNPTIRYNTFFGNMAANYGGGIFNQEGNPTILGNIVVGNSAHAGGGIYISYHGFPILDKNNVWDNHGVNYGDDYYGIDPGPTDISEDPLFVDSQGGDLHLADGSPCIDAGDPSNYPVTDREGDPRPMGLGPDIGADEVRTLGITKISTPDSVEPGELISYTMQIVNLDQVVATGVMVTDVLPAEVGFLGYQGDGISCSHDGASQGGTVLCSMGDLAPGAGQTLTMTVVATNTLPSPLQVTNAVTTTSVNGLIAVDQAATWLSWCAVRLNDGPVGDDIQAAINSSTVPTDVVKVSGRCLVHDIVLNKTLTLQGGWSSDFTTHDPRIHTTTLDAHRMGRVLEVSGYISVSPIIEDFLFSGGLSAEGGGIYNDSSSPTIQNNIIQGNGAYASYGGGIFSYNGDPIILNNMIQGNMASANGAGIFSNEGNPTIEYNTIVGNDGGAGIYSWIGSPTIRHNIIVSNSVTASGIGGLHHYAAGLPDVDYNNVWHNGEEDYGGITPGTHDISADPLFVDADGGDLRLGDGSPCIDSGNPADYPPDDREGDPRPLGQGPDIGADEFRTLGVPKTSFPGMVAPGETITYTVELVNLDDLDATNVVLTDVLPLEVNLLSYQSEGLVCTLPSARTVNCTLGSLPTGGREGLTLTVSAADTLPSPVLVSNIVTTTSSNGLAARDQADAWISWCKVRLNDGPVGDDLQAAINASTVPTDVVKVSGRCLVHDIVLNKTLTLQGGWRSDFGLHDAGTYLTTLDAQRMGRVLAVSGNVSPIIEDFLITGGLSGRGGGINNNSGSPIIRNNTFQGNWSVQAGGGGGGIYNSTGSPAIQSNTFQGNASYWSGGAISNNGGSPAIQSNSFHDNSVGSGSGGGIYSYSGNLAIQGNAFHNNSAGDGGGLSIYDGNSTIQNNVFFGNAASGSGGGILDTGDGAAIQYNTFYGNVADRYYGGGIYSTSFEPTSIRNNVVVSNSAPYGGGLALQGLLLDLDYNNVWGNTGGDYYYLGSGVTPGPNNISADPLFLNPNSGDLHLTAGSPSIDAGDPNDYLATDYEGDPRPLGLGPDMGADEFRTLGVLKTSITDTVAPGETFTYTVELVNLDNLDATNVVLTDVLPLEVNLLSYQSEGLVCTLPSARTVNCTLGSLPTGGREGLTLTVSAADTLPSPVLVSNIVTTTSSNGLAARDQAGTWISWCKVRLNDGPVGDDLQAAINASTVPTDVVKVSGRCLVHDIVLNKTLTLQGGWRSDFGLNDASTHPTTLDAQRMGRVLEISENASPIVEDFLFTGGLTGRGGGINNNDGSPTIQNNIFLNNAENRGNGGGGGIHNNTGSPIVQGNTFQGNVAGDGGGGITNQSGSPIIQNNTFQGNISDGAGGAILNYLGSPIIQENTFRNNSARVDGGGLYTQNGNSTIQNNVFRSNSAVYGGGLFTENDHPTIQNNVFVGNAASYSGGGLFTESGNPTIQNNVFFGNAAEHSGGGIMSDYYSGAAIQYNTFYSNTAVYEGGGIYSNYSETGIIHSNIVVGNTAQNGGGLALKGSFLVLDYNNAWGNTGGDYYFWGSGESPGTNDISADPLFLNPISGDLHLTAGSPCIDTGDPDDFPDTDFEGDTRPDGLAPDIGADEYSTEYPDSVSGTDHSWLEWDEGTGTYTRIYPDGNRIHFNTDGTHDYTLEPNGRQTTYTYNSDDTVTTMGIVLPGEETPRWVWTFHYVDGKGSGIVDPAGRTSTLRVNRHNQLTSIVDPDGVARQYAYNQDDLLTQFTDENGNVTTYDYDEYGRVARITEPPRTVYGQARGQLSVFQEVREFTPSDTNYVLFNNRETGDPDSPGPPPQYSEDLWDRVDYGRGYREGHTNRWGYWLDETDGEDRTTYFQRDQANNLTRIDYPDGTCTIYTYDENGNRLTETQLEAAQCAGTKAILETGQILNRTFTYEERFNQIKTWTDPLSNTKTYIYDYEEGVGNSGNVVRIEYPPVPDENKAFIIPTVSFAYNEWGQVSSETDPLGTITKYIYTQGTPEEAYGQPEALFAAGVTPVPGSLTQVILDYGGLNETTTYRDFDGAGYPQVVIGTNEAATTYYFDAWGRVLTEQNAVGIVTKLEYDGLGNLVKRTQDYTPDGATGRNVVTLYTYNTENRLLSERTEADGLEVGTVYRYDINGKLATQTDGNGNTTIYSYDDADQLVAKTDPLGYTTAYNYTLNGQAEAVIWPDGAVDSFVYDSFGRPVQEIIDDGGLNLTTSYTYDHNGNLLTETDPAGTINCFEYDALNRLVTEIKDCGGLDLTTAYRYDLAGNLLLRTDPQGVSYRHQYDTLGRENQLILDDGGLNIVGQYEHDSAGSLVGVTDDQGNVYTLEYDDLKRVTRICEDVTGLNLCNSYAYDELGNRATATDPNGITTFTTYNDFGLASEVVKDYGGMAAVTRYGYDNALNLAQIDDANGNETNYAYTARNERSMEMYADGSTVNYSHDARGFVQDRTDQDGSTVSYQYDGAGRLMQREFSTGGNHSFTFDQAGRMTSAMETLVDRESLITVGLNSLGDVISTTESIDGQSWSVHYDYDYVGGVYTLTYPSGAQRVYTLDPLKRISTVQNGAGIPIATYDYRDVDGYGTLAYANGTSNRTDFDALGRITSLTSDMGDYQYGYDAAGNRTYMKRAHLPGQPSDVYQYDDLYQLEQVWYGADATDPSAISNYESIQGYNLDMLRNRLEVNDNGDVEVYLPSDGYQLTNQMNRYEQVDDRVFAYDGRGNTLEDGLNTYSYDILNRQTSISGPASNAEYIYNAAGWRIAKMVDGVTTYYAQDVNGQVLEERNADGNMSALYTYGLGIDQPLTMERDGSTYYYHRDAQGSITEVTDSGGNLVEQYTYDIYGAAKIYDVTGDPLSGSAIGNPYLYTARRYDPESSNYYFRARYYTPATGRFLQMDPVGYVDGMNLYASYFVLNSTDPSGLKFAVELFKGDIHGGLGGSLSVEVEFDFKDCCVGGTTIEDGERTYTLKIAATFGLGLGAAAKVVGTGVSLGVSGPELVGEGAFSAKNTECGGPVNTLEHCRSAGIDLGAKGNIGAIAYTFEVAYKVQGQLKLCGAIGTGKASIDLSFCGTLTLELNQQIGPLKLPIWKHKNSIEDQCISLVKRSWPLPG